MYEIKIKRFTLSVSQNAINVENTTKPETTKDRQTKRQDARTATFSKLLTIRKIFQKEENNNNR